MFIGVKITRRFWLLLHRYAGLAMALFLIIAGLTGTILAFYEEIDHYLNQRLFFVSQSSEPISPLRLRRLAEEIVPRARVDSVGLHRPPDRSARFYLQPRIDPATESPYELEFDEIFLDPHDGRVLGKRSSQDGILPFIYRLHYTLVIPEPWGRWLMGVTALIWTVDCFVGFYLTLPVRRRRFWQGWKSAWLVKWRASPYRITFDLHRAAGLWTWAILLILAISSVQYNLYDELFYPALKGLLPVKDVNESIPLLSHPLDEPRLTWEQALRHGRMLMAEKAAQQNFTIEFEDNLRLDRERGIFIYSVKSSLNIRDRIGDTRVVFSAIDGRDFGFTHPYVAAGNTVSQWLGALHTGRIGGLPYRVFLSSMGLIVTLLSITGLVIWWRKRKKRFRPATIGPLTLSSRPPSITS